MEKKIDPQSKGITEKAKTSARALALLFFLFPTQPRAEEKIQFDDKDEPSDTYGDDCYTKVRGRRVHCSYSPFERNQISFTCKCGWGTYFEDHGTLPPDRVGQSLAQLKSYCKAYAKKRCAPVERPIFRRCRHKESECTVEQPYYGVDTGKSDIGIHCNCGPKNTHSLRWSVELTQVDGHRLPRREIQGLCERELAICKDSGLAHRDHFKLDPYANPELRDYYVDCGSPLGLGHMSRTPYKGGEPTDGNWFRCFHSTPQSYEFPATDTLNVLGRCLERLGECDPSIAHARSFLPPERLSSQYPPRGCDRDQCCMEPSQELARQCEP